MQQGRLIVFEGLDGSGKSTQIKLVEDWLLDMGVNVVTTRQPGGTRLGGKIRNLLLDSSNDSICTKTELLLFAADCVQHTEEFIKPNLAAGKVILCDRHTKYSALAYQYYGKQLSRFTRTFITNLTSDVSIDLCVLLDIDAATHSERLKSRTKLDRLEQRDDAYWQRVCDGYRIMETSTYTPEMYKIDATQEKVIVFQEVKKLISQELKLYSYSKPVPKNTREWLQSLADEALEEY